MSDSRHVVGFPVTPRKHRHAKGGQTRLPLYVPPVLAPSPTAADDRICGPPIEGRGPLPLHMLPEVVPNLLAELRDFGLITRDTDPDVLVALLPDYSSDLAFPAPEYVRPHVVAWRTLARLD